AADIPSCPPHAARPPGIQLADVPYSVAAAIDAPQPAGADRVVVIAAGGACPPSVCICQTVFAGGGDFGPRRFAGAARGHRARYERQHAPGGPVATGLAPG